MKEKVTELPTKKVCFIQNTIFLFKKAKTGIKFTVVKRKGDNHEETENKVQKKVKGNKEISYVGTKSPENSKKNEKKETKIKVLFSYD